MGRRSLDWHKVEFVDTHCHLDFVAYQHDLSDVIKRAVDGGVNRIVVPGLNLESSREITRLVERYPEVFGAVGVHPGDVDSWQPNQLEEFASMIQHDKIVAVGEIGLDFYHRKDNLPRQQEVLEVFLDLALRYDKPVILHSRDCLQTLIRQVEKHTPPNSNKRVHGVFHAFEGNYADAEELISMDFYLGAGGPVTYKNASIKHEVFSKIDLSHVLLETDGPFLSPQAHRGKRNEPAWIPIIAEKIADLRQCDIKVVAEVTSRNAKTLFYWND